MTRRVLVLAVALTVLVGCGEDPPEQGDVVNRKFTPAHWEGGYETVYVSKYVCHPVRSLDPFTGEYVTVDDCGYEPVADQVYEPHHTRVDDRWELRLRECVVNDKGDRKCREGWLPVDETTYHGYKIGSHYPDPG